MVQQSHLIRTRCRSYPRPYLPQRQNPVHTKKIKHDPAIHKSADPQDTISGTHKSADQPTLGVQSTETHENNKTALILGSIIVGSTALIIYEIY